MDRKIQITQARIIEWYQHFNGNVCVSFSGGKDSTVLLHIARQIYPNIRAVFSNTGLEYASIQKFVRSWDNVDIVVPKMRFDEVISTYGYPLIGKEVAEAIYYARRIRSQSVQVERERERERERSDANGWNSLESESHQDERSRQQENGTARAMDQPDRAELRKLFPQGKGRRMLQPNPRDPLVFNFRSGGGQESIRKRVELCGRHLNYGREQSSKEDSG